MVLLPPGEAIMTLDPCLELPEELNSSISKFPIPPVTDMVNVSFWPGARDVDEGIIVTKGWEFIELMATLGIELTVVGWESVTMTFACIVFPIILADGVHRNVFE